LIPSPGIKATKAPEEGINLLTGASGVKFHATAGYLAWALGRDAHLDMLSRALGQLEEKGEGEEEGRGVGERREKRRGGGPSPPSRPKAVLYIAKGDRIFLADSVELSVT
jgi:hypothetical protein